MTRPEGRGTFVENDDELLWLGMTARNFGRRPSELIRVPDEIDALDFDTAVTLRLAQYDNDRENDKRKWLARLLGATVGGDETGDDSVLDSAILNDKYADKNTQMW